LHHKRNKLPRLVAKSLRSGFAQLLKRDRHQIEACNLNELNIALSRMLGGRPEDYATLTGGNSGAYTRCFLKGVADETGTLIAFRTLSARERAFAMAKAVKHPVVSKHASVKSPPQRFVNYPQAVTA